MGELNEVQTESRRDTLVSALEKVESQAQPTPTVESAAKEDKAPVQQAAEVPQTERARQPDGKFAKQEKSEKPVETAAERKAREYPGTWKKDYEPVYRKIETNPEFSSILDEIERRENDMRKGIEQYKAQADFAQRFQKTLQPFEQTFNQLGLQPDVAIQRLLSADHAFRYGSPAHKQQLAMQFLQSYGIDPQSLMGGEQAQVDPNTSRFQQELAEMRQTQQTLLSSIQQQYQQDADQTVQQFRKDNPLMEHDEVRMEMGRLIDKGICSTLPEAYERAIYGLPQIREKVLAEQQAKAEADRKQKAAAEAERAKAANVQVRGAPNGNAQSASLKAKDRRSAILEIANRMS